jgi:hypothetical protein
MKPMMLIPLLAVALVMVSAVENPSDLYRHLHRHQRRVYLRIGPAPIRRPARAILITLLKQRVGTNRARL